MYGARNLTRTGKWIHSLLWACEIFFMRFFAETPYKVVHCLGNHCFICGRHQHWIVGL